MGNEVAGPPTNLAAASRLARRSIILYSAAALLALIGLGDSLYLTIEHLSGRSVRCTVIAGCAEVLSSSYATIGDVPLAALGAAAYFAVFSLAVLAAFGYRFAAPVLRTIVILMFLTTLWLLYLQAFVIRHFCQFCLLSAAVTIMLTIIVSVLRWSHSRSPYM